MDRSGESRARICVFAGSSDGRRADYREAADALADALVGAGFGLVYGGAHVGLMGAVADGVLGRGGEVIGVIPEPLVRKEVAHHGLTELRVVDSMHERKAQMADLASAFIALPGGIGTLEELFEVLTWTQLGLHRKPCGLLNTAGYWDGITTFLGHAVAEGFLKPVHAAMLRIDDDPARLVEILARYEVPAVDKWIGRDER